MMRKRTFFSIGLVVAMVFAVGRMGHAQVAAPAAALKGQVPQFTADGQLVAPKDYR